MNIADHDVEIFVTETLDPLQSPRLSDPTLVLNPVTTAPATSVGSGPPQLCRDDSLAQRNQILITWGWRRDVLDAELRHSDAEEMMIDRHLT